MEYSREALGQVIRELREARAPKLSQEELGRKAGYRTGAGVSMPVGTAYPGRPHVDDHAVGGALRPRGVDDAQRPTEGVEGNRAHSLFYQPCPSRVRWA